MNSLIRYRLKKIRDSSSNDTIPWSMFERYPGSRDIAVEIIIAKSYDIIISAMDNAVKENTTILNNNEIEHLILISAFLSARSATIIDPKDIYKYMIRRIPIEFSKELESELGTIESDIPLEFKEENTGEDGFSLPSNPALYVEAIKTLGVSKYVDEYSFYNRTHLYRILNRNS